MDVSDWSPPIADLDLQSHQVDIWRIKLDLPPASVKTLESTLSADESQRIARFHFPTDKDRYTIAHGALRDILARYLNCEPTHLKFSTNEYGKPALDSHSLQFNLSHSGDYALVTVAPNRKVGVDVECIRSDMEYENIARRFFSSNEVAELIALPPKQRELAFFRCWTRKEAYIKARGLGLSLPLASFDVSLSPHESSTLRATRPDAQEAARWALISLEVDPGYAAAVAVEGQELEFRLWDWVIR